MSQRISAGWTLYFFAILAAAAATFHAWSAGAQYFGNEFRTVELTRVWSNTDDEKVTWRGEYMDETTKILFESDVKPRVAEEFQKAGSKPERMALLLEIGVVDPIAKQHHDNFYLYRWVSSVVLFVLLFWWLIIQCPELFVIFAIFSD